eukprot:TRINITY_DN4733_c0_g1_i1.p1 TRINITY_DN4733_c0_g1~~TRINITY_DN4733_c0_g1_i1.p1  ORF type:complete len:397 (-),score=117.94 TRINITY_DN4733_c0_g1_i1:185-1261(-)
MELLKAWKALFFCMWHSDKPIVQHELAERLSNFNHLYKNQLQWLIFTGAFWKTMDNHWNDIDRLRLDKYYSLLRLFFCHNLKYLADRKWDIELVKEFSKLLHSPSGPFHHETKRGIIYHMADIFLEEVEKNLDGKPLFTIDTELFGTLLDPVFALISNVERITLPKVKKFIFNELLEKWVEFIHVDPSSEEAQSVDFKDNQKLIADHLSNISKILFSKASSSEINLKNRAALYTIREKIEQARVQLTGEVPNVPIDVTPVVTKKAPKRKASQALGDEDAGGDDDGGDEMGDDGMEGDDGVNMVGGDDDEEVESKGKKNKNNNNKNKKNKNNNKPNAQNKKGVKKQQIKRKAKKQKTTK